MNFTIQTQIGENPLTNQPIYGDAREFDVENFGDGWRWTTDDDQSNPFPSAFEAQQYAISYAREEDARPEEEERADREREEYKSEVLATFRDSVL